MANKLTIAELEDLLDDPNLSTEILSNGEIRSFNWQDRIDELECGFRELLNDCINFGGGELTDSVMERATKLLKKEEYSQVV